MPSKKTISRETHLMALALFTMAQKNVAQTRAIEIQLSELLGYEDTWCGCLSDEIYDPNGRFDVGLKKDGFAVAASKKKRKSR